jgi:hypothetical protein
MWLLLKKLTTTSKILSAVRVGIETHIAREYP